MPRSAPDKRSDHDPGRRDTMKWLAGAGAVVGAEASGIGTAARAIADDGEVAMGPKTSGREKPGSDGAKPDVPEGAEVKAKTYPNPIDLRDDVIDRVPGGQSSYLEKHMDNARANVNKFYAAQGNEAKMKEVADMIKVAKGFESRLPLYAYAHYYATYALMSRFNSGYTNEKKNEAAAGMDGILVALEYGKVKTREEKLKEEGWTKVPLDKIPIKSGWTQNKDGSLTANQSENIVQIGSNLQGQNFDLMVRIRNDGGEMNDSAGIFVPAGDHGAWVSLNASGGTQNQINGIEGEHVGLQADREAVIPTGETRDVIIEARNKNGESLISATVGDGKAKGAQIGYRGKSSVFKPPADWKNPSAGRVGLRASYKSKHTFVEMWYRPARPGRNEVVSRRK